MEHTVIDNEKKNEEDVIEEILQYYETFLEKQKIKPKKIDYTKAPTQMKDIFQSSLVNNNFDTPINSNRNIKKKVPIPSKMTLEQDSQNIKKNLFYYFLIIIF